MIIICLRRNWNKELEKSKFKSTYTPSLFKALFSLMGSNYLMTWIPVGIVECVFKVLQAIFLRLLVQSFNDPDPDASVSLQYLYAAGVTLSTLFTSLVFHPAFYEINKICARCRVALSSLVYRKTLRLSKASHEQTTVGQITNILSNDVNRFDNNLLYIPYIVLAPIQAIIFLYFLWEEFGVSSLAGFSIIIVLIPFQCKFITFNQDVEVSRYVKLKSIQTSKM